MQIEVTPMEGYADMYTVTLAGKYRLSYAGTKDNATQVATELRRALTAAVARLQQNP
jgi:hypothetical protein